MKKLVMAMAIALATVAAQAEDEEEFEEENDVWVYIKNVYKPGTSEGFSGTAYLIYSGNMSQSAAVTAFNSAPSPKYLVASPNAFTTAYLNGGNSTTADDNISLVEMYVICFDKDSNYDYMYVSPVANPQGYSYNFNAAGTSGALARSASDGWQGAGWYTASSNVPEPTSPVPEPTSGLLMLLGVAGLALKRKRA